MKGQARFEDVVSLNARSLDYHLKGTVFKIQQLQGNHDVPLRALTPQGVENLVVAGAWVDEGPTLKRWRPRAHGRATGVRRRTSHVTIVVRSLEEVSGGT